MLKIFKVCKSGAFSNWQWPLYAIDGITTWAMVLGLGLKLCQLSKHLIKVCGTSLGPVQHELASIKLIYNFVLHEMAWIKSEKLPTASLRFSLLKNDLEDFLDILESLQCAL